MVVRSVLLLLYLFNIFLQQIFINLIFCSVLLIYLLLVVNLVINPVEETLSPELGCGILAAEISRNEVAWNYMACYQFSSHQIHSLWRTVKYFGRHFSETQKACVNLVTPKKLYPVYSPSTCFKKVNFFSLYKQQFWFFFFFQLNWLLNVWICVS